MTLQDNFDALGLELNNEVFGFDSRSREVELDCDLVEGLGPKVLAIIVSIVSRDIQELLVNFWRNFWCWSRGRSLRFWLCLRFWG